MSLTKDEFKRLDFVIQEIYDILGEQDICGVIGTLAALKRKPELQEELMGGLLELEREIDS
ncbi:MAG: hypothetical protein GWO20_09080, partial [Candidatus Korarchaeota archaeon]|nr:hypothetical protein [Candidatus Korarchaeota archaeon]